MATSYSSFAMPHTRRALKRDLRALMNDADRLAQAAAEGVCDKAG
jgi:hypothetical protein